MEGSDIKSGRNVLTTIFLVILAVGFFCFFFFVPFKFPAISGLVVVCGLVYFLDAFGLSKFFLPGHRRKELAPILGMLAGAGWFTCLGANHLHHNEKVWATWFATAGMILALSAAWGISRLLRSNKAGLIRVHSR